MHNVSMIQALSVWSELEQAYYGDNGFGGDTAEIYAYRLARQTPHVTSEQSTSLKRDNRFQTLSKNLSMSFAKLGTAMRRSTEKPLSLRWRDRCSTAATSKFDVPSRDAADCV